MSLASIPKPVLAAGGALANAAYNLAQCSRLSDSERSSLNGARLAWDAAIEAVHAAAQAAPKFTPELVSGEQALEEAIDKTLRDIAAAGLLPLGVSPYALLPLQTHLTALLAQRAALLAHEAPVP